MASSSGSSPQLSTPRGKDCTIRTPKCQERMLLRSPASQSCRHCTHPLDDIPGPRQYLPVVTSVSVPTSSLAGICVDRSLWHTRRSSLANHYRSSWTLAAACVFDSVGLGRVNMNARRLPRLFFYPSAARSITTDNTFPTPPPLHPSRVRQARRRSSDVPEALST